MRRNRWLPQIELAAGLEGGGSVVFVEFVDGTVADLTAGDRKLGNGHGEAAGR